MEKEDSKLFKHKADFSTGILLIYHFVLNLTTKSFTLLKHRDVFAYVLVCNSCEKTWFRQLESTPLGYYAHTCRRLTAVFYCRCQAYYNFEYDALFIFQYL